MKTNQIRLVGVAAAFAVAASALTGCFANPVDRLLEGGIENIIEKEISKELGEDFDIDINPGGVADFPTVIPQPQGKVTASIKAGEGWIVSYEAQDASVYQAHKVQMLAAGFTSVVDSDASGTMFTIYTGHGYSIQAGYTPDDKVVTLIVGKE